MQDLEEKKDMINDLVSKISDKRFRKILKETKNDYIQPGLLKKFKRNRARVLEDNLLRE